MSFILSVDCANRNTEYFQATKDETVLELKQRYCTKHGFTLDQVTVFVGERQHEKPMMAAALKPWSADGKPKGFLGLF